MATAQKTLPGMRGFLGHTHGEPVVATYDSLAVTIPGIKLESLNSRLRVMSRGAMIGASVKAKRIRGSIAMVLRSKFGTPPVPPMTVTIIRIAPGELDDDNLAGACKNVRDGIADWLGVDDRTKRSGVVWCYAQARDGRSYAVGIRMERGEV